MNLSNIIISNQVQNVELKGRVITKSNKRSVIVREKRTLLFTFIFNDGFGEISMTFWQSDRNFLNAFNLISVGSFLSIENFLVSAVADNYNYISARCLKPVINTRLKIIDPIVNFKYFQVARIYRSLQDVINLPIGHTYWVTGEVKVIGEAQTNLRNDNVHRRLVLVNNDVMLEVTLWGEYYGNINVGDFLDLPGKVSDFNYQTVFSGDINDIRVFICLFNYLIAKLSILSVLIIKVHDAIVLDTHANSVGVASPKSDKVIITNVSQNDLAKTTGLSASLSQVVNDISTTLAVAKDDLAKVTGLSASLLQPGDDTIELSASSNVSTTLIALVGAKDDLAKVTGLSSILSQVVGDTSELSASSNVTTTLISLDDVKDVAKATGLSSILSQVVGDTTELSTSSDVLIILQEQDSNVNLKF